jgi:hypothetical protein
VHKQARVSNAPLFLRSAFGMGFQLEKFLDKTRLSAILKPVLEFLPVLAGFFWSLI